MKNFILLISGLLLLGGVAVAQQMTFEELDADADGALSKTEVESIEILDFDVADTDKNGSLSQEEFDAVNMEGE